jgi:hypothetical protein
VHWLLASNLAHGVEPSGDTPSGTTPSATLSLAVHRDAGTVASIAADGAAGQCVIAGQALHCPASGPVTFRWGADPAWVLVGDLVLQPGEVGTATVWASEASRAAELERLAGPVDAALVRELFLRTGDHEVPVPSAQMWARLLDLARHSDDRVRRVVVDALLPYWRHTASDPFPAGGPPVVPPGLLVELSEDPSRLVRRRLASRLRDVVAPGQPLAEVANQVLLHLATEQERGVQRAAFASLAVRARRGESPGLEAWQAALDRVTLPGSPGRAAANTLAGLATELSPGPEVDPALAIARTAEVHLERVWNLWKAWRSDVPFEPLVAERLLRETVGVSAVLFRSWAEDDPAGLAALLRRWEPRAPHSDRYVYLVRSLMEPVPSALAPLVADTLSAEPTGAVAQ